MRAIGRQIRRAFIFALAAKSPGLCFDIALACQRIIRNGEFDRLQAFQFVAIARASHMCFSRSTIAALKLCLSDSPTRRDRIDRDMVLLIDGAQNIRDPRLIERV